MKCPKCGVVLEPERDAADVWFRNLCACEAGNPCDRCRGKARAPATHALLDDTHVVDAYVCDHHGSPDNTHAAPVPKVFDANKHVAAKVAPRPDPTPRGGKASAHTSDAAVGYYVYRCTICKRSHSFSKPLADEFGTAYTKTHPPPIDFKTPQDCPACGNHRCASLQA